MWGIVTCDRKKPTDDKVANYATLLDSWENNNSKIITQINNFVIQSISNRLTKYDTTMEVWDHLARLYTCLLYTSPSPRDVEESRMPSSA